MSKSLQNAVGIHEPPSEMFGKIMSISDAMMWRYLRTAYGCFECGHLADAAALRRWRENIPWI